MRGKVGEKSLNLQGREWEMGFQSPKIQLGMGREWKLVETFFNGKGKNPFFGKGQFFWDSGND